MKSALPILFALSFLGLSLRPLAAQEPAVQATMDTIYALAVDPSAYPDQTSVLLLDEGVVRIEGDGSGVRNPTPSGG